MSNYDFSERVSTVAQQWLVWSPVQRSIVPTAVDYTINEEDPPDQPTMKEVTIVSLDTVTLPQVVLLGYFSGQCGLRVDCLLPTTEETLPSS